MFLVLQGATYGLERKLTQPLQLGVETGTAREAFSTSITGVHVSRAARFTCTVGAADRCPHTTVLAQSLGKTFSR